MNIKALWFWILAHIPHPGYGKCGGAWQDCSGGNAKPKDDLDRAFLEHDADLEWAHMQMIESEKNRLILEANATLCKNLHKEMQIGLYGKIYRFGAKIVFCFLLGNKK